MHDDESMVCPGRHPEDYQGPPEPEDQEPDDDDGQNPSDEHPSDDGYEV